MFDSLTGITWSLEEDGVLAGWCLDCQLIESQNFTASLQDTGTSILADTKGGNSDLGNIVQADVIGDFANNNSDFVFLAFVAQVFSLNINKKMTRLGLTMIGKG